jgi:SAM-dependent methyltransferase
LGDLYRQIGAGFDQSAERYDLEAEANAAMAHMRRVSLAVLGDSFGTGQHVLELGCGTGEEAVALARDGIRVLATDVSSRMLDVARGKVSAAGLEQAVQTRQLAAGELSVLLDELGREAFDGAYSSFGALNGEPDLFEVGSALAKLIRPGGRLVASIMNRFYPFEMLWYLGHGRPRQAVRRWAGGARASVSPSLAVQVPTIYYTPRSFARAFPAFRRLLCRALPLLLPPPFAAHLWSRFPALIGRVLPWEDRLACYWPFGALGDHFLMVLERM